ncbi:lasso peptide biosynthesis PqqD family chaperone [Actinoallomurus sp. CA-150999]|uniref:lasso peptide biosynthesis PqqD family chaperone n=1 Tax=Actinoallomurus sp. CA-150999 TaxID=3239887 RepID=UPI003D8B9643
MTFSLAANVSATDADGGMVLLDERTGRYWALNTTGATILHVLLDGGTPEQAVEGLCRTHPSASARIPADVAALMRSLEDAEVVVS